ncbi:MAG: dihydrofolate reductase [Sphaerospermopsis sp. SIO1G2]|nr:dihydrofolate reductase [Sphaerospermopsis sp. SIO1G2]
MKKLNAIVAYDRNRLIGADGGLPWRYPEDLKFFRQTTMGHAIIHGRKSYEDFGKPLPGRRNIIVTRQQDYQAPGCEVVHDLDEAIALAYESDDDPFILGGAEIYRLALPQCSRLFLTEIDAEHQGDTYFPAVDESCFKESERRPSGILTFRTLLRLGGAHDV